MAVDKQKQGKRNRRYGHDAEREWARELKEAGSRAERITSESKHGNLGDVIHWFLPEFGLKYQLKSGKSPSIWRAMSEALDATAMTPYYPAALLNKSNGPGVPRDRYVVTRAEDWIRLVSLVAQLESDLQRLRNGEPLEPDERSEVLPY